MGFPLDLALRYMRSRKRAFISVGTAFAILGVALGTAALATVMSVTGGFRAQFREKVLGVNAHVLVLKYASEFPEYRDVMAKMASIPEVQGVGPFVINPMMLTHDDHTATGVLVKGVDPERMPQVLDLPRHVIEGSLEGLRLEGATPPKRKQATITDTPSSPSSSGRPPSDEDLLEVLREIVEGTPPTPAATDEYPELDAKLLDPVAEAPPEAALEARAIEPEGGYQSTLPEDDVIPEAIDPDPCAEGASQRLPGIVIGVTLKQRLHAKLGDCIQVTSPTIGYSYARGVMRPPVAKQFRVIGVFEAGFEQYDAKLAYADLFETQAFYDSGDTVTGVEMKIRNIDDSGAVVEKVKTALDNAIYRTMDWEELNHGLFTALKIQQILMSLVLALIIVVAAFTVIATLIMVVLDKKREIAVLKAMGATDWALLRTFLYQGMIIGIVGALGGLCLGYAVCKWIIVYGLPLDPKVYFISHVPVRMRLTDFAFTGVFAVGVCLLATVWPALHAARLRPAEAFREQ